jgi:hypothetical protein
MSPQSTSIDLNRSSGLPSEGVHLFKITDGKEQGSKSSGQPMWVITCQCQDAGEDQGKMMTLFLSLAPQARFKIDQLLDVVEAPKHGSWNLDQFIGKMLKIAVVHGEYEGNPTANAYRMFAASSTATVDLPTKSSSQSGSASPELSSGRKSPF